MTTAYVCNGKTEAETIGHLLEYFETYQLNPKYLVGDQGFMGTELESFYNRKNIRPITLGPGTSWPNRAEAAVRMYKKQITLMLKAVTEDPSRYEITYRQLLRQASLARNSMVTFGGVSPLEMAFGRRPADLLYPENMTPEELTASLPSPEKNIDALRTLAMKSYLEAKQSDDLRRDISARLQLSDGPFYPGDKIYYWTEDKSKVKSDGTHSGKWIKGKVISSDGSMVGIDLGTRILKVNISKVRKDINPIEDVEVPLDPVALLSSESARTDIPVTDHASSLVQSDGAQIGVEGFTYSSYAWQPVMTGKIDILELFAGSARLSQVAAMNGLRVGQPIDLRTGLDILTSDGRKRTMDIIEKQKPKVIFMAPHCAPWSQMTNIHDRAARDQRRQKFLPMLEFCCRVAIFQIEHEGQFIIENPASSALWYTRCFERLLSQRDVTYGTLDMCSFGMKDPNGYYYNKPTSLLHNFDEGVFSACVQEM